MYIYHITSLIWSSKLKIIAIIRQRHSCPFLFSVSRDFIYIFFLPLVCFKFCLLFSSQPVSPVGTEKICPQTFKYFRITTFLKHLRSKGNKLGWNYSGRTDPVYLCVSKMEIPTSKVGSEASITVSCSCSGYSSSDPCLVWPSLSRMMERKVSCILVRNIVKSSEHRGP